VIDLKGKRQWARRGKVQNPETDNQQLRRLAPPRSKMKKHIDKMKKHIDKTHLLYELALVVRR
jgi:hypothetical protein